MTEGSDSDYDVVQLPDSEDDVYLIGVDERTTGRMLETINERFDGIFENATYVVFTADIVTEGDLEVHRFESEEVKESMQDFEDADDVGEQMAAVHRMRGEHTEDGDGPRLDDEEFRSLMDLTMVSDPWPLDDDSEESVERLLASEAARRGFDGWYEAYHGFEVEDDG